MATNELSAAPLSEQERVDFKQLVEIIVETDVSDELLEDVISLSESVIESARDDGGSTADFSKSSVYSDVELIIRELLLDVDESNSVDEASDRKLKEAAKLYRVEAEELSESEVTSESSQDVLDRLFDGFNQLAMMEDGVQLTQDAMPEHFSESDRSDWLESFGYSTDVGSSAVSAGDSSLVEDDPVQQSDAESDLRRQDFDTDVTDDDEWKVVEIDLEDDLDDGRFEDLDEHNQDHVHQILEDEIRSIDEYEGTPADDREVATLALIAEGILFAELSDILLQDLIAEAGSLIRNGRAKGSDWWMTREATSEVAELLSTVLIGSGWPTPESQDDETVLSAGRNHRELLKHYAATYPLDPEPTREERLKHGSLSDRYELLLAERGDRAEESPSVEELKNIARSFTELFGEIPTQKLVEDMAQLYSDEAIVDSRRLGGFHRSFKAVDELRVGTKELLLGKVDYKDRLDELNSAIRTYRTEDLTEDEFIAHYDQTRWPSVGATVDLSIFTIIDGKLQVLLIERGNHPEKGKWALPGGFVNTDESLDQAAARELQEETSVNLSTSGYLEQVKTYGYPGRDRRGFIISTLYVALIADVPEPDAGDDASNARFVPVDEALGDDFQLAFDHDMLLRDALERIRAKIEYSPIVFDFLPDRGFTLTQLREVYETVWGFEISPSDFSRRMCSTRALGISSNLTDGKVLWTRGLASTFFPPLDRREVSRV